MNEFNKILGKSFSKVSRIIVTEGSEPHQLFDSLLFSSENEDLKFQIQTNQKGISIIFVKDESNLVIDGEYNIEKIEYENMFKSEKNTIKEVDVFWDETKLYIVGFVFICNDMKLCFIRLVDEINLEFEEEFYKQMENVKSYTVEKLLN